ncbi:MAG: serine hydrolase [Vicinamibacterales bacterium]
MSALIWIAAVAALAVAAARTLRVVSRVAAGYKSKVLCTGTFVSQRTMDPARDPQIRDDSYRILRPFTARIDHQTQSVTTSLFGLMPRTAVVRDGLGATLLVDGRPPARLGVAPALRPRVADDGWRRSAGNAALQQLVDAAFDEPNHTRRRRTQAVVVVQDGCVVAERYSSGITADMPLPGWSMAKSVLNGLVGVLVGEGRLTLDGRELMPEWQAPDPRASVSLDDLLRMRSGLRFSEQYGWPWSDVLHMLYASDDMAAYAASRPLAAEPGAVWQYASGTTNILSRIVRRVVGDEHYWQWPSRALFDRIHMRSAQLETDASGTFVCSSYMVATACDWARYGQLWLDNGAVGSAQVLTPDWVRYSTTPTTQSPNGRYGAHWWLGLNPDIGGESAAAQAIAPDTYFAVGHEGQTITVMPSRRAVVVRLGASIYIDAWNHAEFTARLQDALPA